MSQEIYFTLVNVRKYLREDRLTGEREIVPVTNRNALPVERHMELLNLNPRRVHSPMLASQQTFP